MRKLLLDLKQRLFSRNAILEKLAIGGTDVTGQIVPEDRGARVAHVGKLHLAKSSCQTQGS